MSTPREFIDAYINAYEALDVEAFLALYADDARVFDSAEPAEYPDKAAWRGQVVGWFSSLERNGEAECDFEDVEIIETAELAVVNGHIEYEGTIVGTDEEVELESRATFVLQKFDDQWLIIHEHTSIPVEFDEDDFDDEFDEDEEDGAEAGEGKLLGDQGDLAVEGEGHRSGLLGEGESHHPHHHHKLLGDEDSMKVTGEGHRGGLFGDHGDGDKPTEALNQ